MVASPVKRSYDNATHLARSEANRSRILEVARELITARGYRATTIAEIARTADVHVDTIYELVGRKPEVLRELIERAISGTDRALADAAQLRPSDGPRARPCKKARHLRRRRA